jgi:hypothetical protein
MDNSSRIEIVARSERGIEAVKIGQAETVFSVPGDLDRLAG